VSEPGRQIPFRGSELEGRLGSKVLPAAITVVDDPTQREFRGKALLGYYPVDLEGVTPQPLTLIENGALKAFLLTRQPVKGFTASNGRARIPGPFGHKVAGTTNLFVKTSEPVPAGEMKNKLIELVKQRNKNYGILVRKMDFPSTASFEELRSLAMGAGNNQFVSAPLLAYRVYPDGREELVRGVRFRGLGVRSLRDIVAASDEQYQFNFLGNGRPLAITGFGTSYIYGSSVVAPSILLDDLEMEKPVVESPKPPLVAPPSSSAE
jgi:predicted Zn-dependent protease